MSLNGRLYFVEFHSLGANIKLEAVYYQSITVLEAYGHSESASQEIADSLVKHIESTFEVTQGNNWIRILRPVDCDFINGVSYEFREHLLINRVQKYGDNRCRGLEHAWWMLIHSCLAEEVHLILTEAGHPKFPDDREDG